jgi:2-polyprenyl-3-methyl-5-hydroxy-6-metoxy-1,4-benzoquinol methylase
MGGRPRRPPTRGGLWLMREEILPILACPACGCRLELQPLERDRDEVISGVLRCMGCGSPFAIRRGVPRLNRAMQDLQDVADAFAFEWKAHHAGQLETDTVFGRTRQEDWAHFVEGTGLSADELDGKRVLDAGCGSGSLTREVGERGAGMVVGVDMSDAIDEVFELTRDLPNVHVLQANLLALPFNPGSFDVVWSCGVIHHTPDAARAFRALARQAGPRGVLYVWVYAKRFNPFRATKTALDRLGLGRLSPRSIMRVARVISYPSLALLGLYRLVRRLPGLRPRTAWGWRTVRARGLREVQLTWNDALTPRYDSRHSEAEVIGWFRDAGFGDITAIEEPKVGVRGVAPATTSPTTCAARFCCWAAV